MDRNDSRAWRKALMYTVLGFEVSGAVVGSAAIGYLLDNWLDSAPIGILIMLLLGSVGAMIRLVSLARTLQKK